MDDADIPDLPPDDDMPLAAPLAIDDKLQEPVAQPRQPDAVSDDMAVDR